MHNSQIHRSCS